MKNVLILSYYFPPMGMGGTQRILGFVKHLPEFGWQPTVITVKDVAYYARDNTLLDEISKANIQRTGSLDPLRLSAIRLLKGKPALATATATATATANKSTPTFLLKTINFFLVPDNKILWAPFAYYRAKSLLRKCRFDAIISTGPPHSSHLVAKKLTKKFQLPWIADFRDTWANGDFQAKATKLHKWLDMYLQKKVLQSASHITAVSEGLVQRLQNSAQQSKKKFTIITNGFEEEDSRTQEKAQDECFDVVHVGAIGNFANPELAIRAFRSFVEDAQLSQKETKLHFVGADLTGRLPQQIAASGILEFINTTGYVPHAEAVKYLQHADVLLFLVSGGPYSGFIPGKTFEYLAARKPVLAISEQIEGLELLRKTGLVRHVTPNDLFGTVNAFKAAYLDFKKNKLPTHFNFDFRQFTRRELTQKLAGVLESRF